MAEYASYKSVRSDLTDEGLPKFMVNQIIKDLKSVDAEDGNGIKVFSLDAGDTAPAGAELIARDNGDGTVTYTVPGVDGASTVGDTSDSTIKGSDAVFAGGGDDTVKGTGGNDTLQGGGGKDVISSAGGHDKLEGGGGADSLLGGSGRDTLTGGDGNDTLGGGNGKDMLYGDAGDDSLSGGAKADMLYGGGGKDTLDGGGGNDTLTGGGGADDISGGGGADYIFGSGADTIDGGAGKDTLRLEGFDEDDVNVKTRANDVTKITFADGKVMKVTNVEKVEFDDDIIDL